MIAGGLYLDIDPGEVAQIARDMVATPRQVELALGRAASRTAGALRAKARRALVSGLELKRQNTLRKRLKAIKLRASSKGGSVQAAIWVGLNDLPIPDLKGKPEQDATGARFRGRRYPGGFVKRSARGPSIFVRAGKSRLPIVEQTYPIKDQADVILEDEVFPDVAEEIFMRAFIADLRYRVTYRLGES